MIRDARADFRKKLMDAKNEKMISEDEFKRDEAELQKTNDIYMENWKNWRKRKKGKLGCRERFKTVPDDKAK